MTKRAKEYMNADFVYEDYKNLAEAQKIADVEDVTAISERLIKQNMEAYKELTNCAGADKNIGRFLTTAFTIFVKQAIREQGIPFEITREIPNSETISAINEVQQMKQNPSLGKSYTDIDKMMIDLTI